MIANAQSQFSLGQIVATPGALVVLGNAGQTAIEFLQRHVKGDWGSDASRFPKACDGADCRLTRPALFQLTESKRLRSPR
jgi:hypothetical protein